MRYQTTKPSTPKSNNVCFMCNGKPKYQGVFTPHGSTRFHFYLICGKCQAILAKDPALMAELEEKLIQGGLELDAQKGAK